VLLTDEEIVPTIGTGDDILVEALPSVTFPDIGTDIFPGTKVVDEAFACMGVFENVFIIELGEVTDDD